MCPVFTFITKGGMSRMGSFHIRFIEKRETDDAEFKDPNGILYLAGECSRDDRDSGIRGTAGERLRYSLRACWLTGLLVVLLMNPARADEVIMKDGSRLLGTVVSMASGKLVFETPFAGKITIDWDQVARLTTEGLVEVSLGDDQTLKGRAVAADEDTLVLQPESGPVTRPISMAEVKALASPSPPERWQFHGRIAAGFSREGGNTEKDQLNLDGQLELFKRPHRINAYGELSLETSFGETTTDKGLFTASYDRFVSEKWYLFGRGQTQRDEFSDLEFLGVLAAGVGHQFWKSPQKNLSLEIGPSYVTENYTQNQEFLGNSDHRNYTAAFWLVNFDIWFFSRFVQFFHTNSGTWSLEDSDVWRLLTRTGLRVPLAHKLFGSLQYNYDWVNSPADGKKNYDEALLLKLGLEW